MAGWLAGWLDIYETSRILSCVVCLPLDLSGVEVYSLYLCKVVYCVLDNKGKRVENAIFRMDGKIVDSRQTSSVFWDKERERKRSEGDGVQNGICTCLSWLDL
jgi:hypothetical protein